MPLVKSIRRCKKARPGITTEEAKLRSPMNDWTSCKVAFLRGRKDDNKARVLVILLAGKQASSLTVSSSIPANVKVVREQLEHPHIHKATKNSSSEHNTGHKRQPPSESRQVCE